MTKIIALLLVVLFVSADSNASEQKITKELIQASNQKMASVLKERDPKETIDFLHSHISESAIFQVNFDNPFLPANTKQKPLQMDKTAYIKTFIDGLHYVDSYDVKINTAVIQISDNGNEALAKQTMTEEGIMLNPHNLNEAGIPFTSKTTCTVYYTMQQGNIQSDKAKCTTQTGQINGA